ncbi:MFS transporter [Saccharopolyspora shandongensis]|uniref:MFS transporter n=1 Tax=Saccharopolyspora shandongensis TaxID=418495 RepID=UPI0033E802F1
MSRPGLLVFALNLANLVTIVDTTIITIAIPQISSGTGLTLSSGVWLLDAYLIPLTVFIVTAGRLGDRYGPKILYLIGLSLFAAMSLCCGLASTPTAIIASRALQGLGAALVTPQVFSMIARALPSHKQAGAFALSSVISGIAGVMGPALGGLLLYATSWRWIFLINLPICLVSFLLALATAPSMSGGEERRTDFTGIALFTSALTLISFGVVEGNRFNWGQVWHGITIPHILSLGAVLLVLYLLSQRRPNSLTPLALLRRRNTTLINLVSVTVQFGTIGVYVSLPVLLRQVLELDVKSVGFVLAAMPASSVLVALATKYVSTSIGLKYTLVVGLLSLTAGLLLVASNARFGGALGAIVAGLLLGGVGTGLIFPVRGLIAMQDAPRLMVGAASGVLSTTRQLGSVLAASVTGAFLQVNVQTTVESGLPANYGDAVRYSLLFCCCLVGVGILFSLVLRQDRSVARTRRGSVPRSQSRELRN